VQSHYTWRAIQPLLSGSGVAGFTQRASVRATPIGDGFTTSAGAGKPPALSETDVITAKSHYITPMVNHQTSRRAAILSMRIGLYAIIERQRAPCIFHVQTLFPKEMCYEIKLLPSMNVVQTITRPFDRILAAKQNRLLCIFPTCMHCSYICYSYAYRRLLG